MHPEILETGSESILVALGELLQKETPSMYLAGGTALALQFGHRQSVDFDFFTFNSFPNDLHHKLNQLGSFKVVSQEARTLHGILSGVRVSFFEYPYQLTFPPILHKTVSLADARDIASMKLDAVSSRGSKKDFIDLYFLIDRYGLSEIIGFFEKRYTGISFNKVHLLKSITYFDDAEHEPMPIMRMSVSWEEIKARLEKEATGRLWGSE